MKDLDLDTLRQYDEVLIMMGHAEADYALRPVFLGAISKIGPNFPLEIECKDWLWLIRRAWHKDSTAKLPVEGGSASLNSIMLELMNNPGVGAEMFDGVELITSPDYDTVKYYGDFPIGNRNYGKIFDDLLQHGWDMFIVPGTKTLWFGPRDNISINYEQMMIPIFRYGLNIISPDLEYVKSSGIAWVEVRVSGKERKSKKPDGWYPKTVEFNEDGEFVRFLDGYIGDRNGEVIKIDLQGLNLLSADASAGMHFLINSKQGISGQIKTFGLGLFQHWMKCRLQWHTPVEERNGIIRYSPIDWHCFPSGIDYIYSPSDGFKMDVHFENSRENGALAA
jgi:hypothetical protein